MLSHLSLRDFAIVSSAELSLDAGMTVVSGETGAGKSLLVDALAALTGARADAGMVRHGAARAELAAEFDLGDAPLARAWLIENEMDDDGSGQLRRVIRADGGSRAWINGRSATLAQLSELGALLVEIHGQHEHQALLDRAHQMALLDAFAQHPGLLETVREQARQWAEADRELTQLARSGDAGERLSYLQHQVDELAAENLDVSAIDRLLAAHRRQSSVAALLAGYDSAIERLSGDEGTSLSRDLRQISGELARHAGSEARLSEVAALLESAEIQLDEASATLQRLRDDLDPDPANLQQLESRLTRLHELARKHRVPLPELAARRDSLAQDLEKLQGQGERTDLLHLARESAAARWRDSAASLTVSRQRAGLRLGGAVSALMHELGMAGGVLSVQLQPREDASPATVGAERCELLVSANPGQPPRPLRKVASGGELARISLAIEVAALGFDSVPTMIFDEVDSGIGGAVAEVVGQKLRALGNERQVLCVTHLPQVAAQGHQHFLASKAFDGAGTHAAVVRLSDKARIEEIARMLGGVEIAREARANARQMLVRAQS